MATKKKTTKKPLTPRAERAKKLRAVAARAPGTKIASKLRALATMAECAEAMSTESDPVKRLELLARFRRAQERHSRS